MASPRRALGPDEAEGQDRVGDDDGTTASAEHEPRHTPKRAVGEPRHRRLTVVAITLAVLLLAGAAAIGFAIQRLQDNINAVDLSEQLGTDRPTVAAPTGPGVFPGPLTIAVFGDDTRSGDNDFIGGDKGTGRSDTTLVVHLNKDRTQIQVVSIPRDSMVQRPSCTKSDGTTVPAALEQFNAAYTHGGPACSIRTIEKLTGVRIDEYVVVDFTGFRKIVDAVGGVEVCIAEPMKDKDSGLDLPAGKSTLDGTQALAFVRTRHAVGDGSDLARISLQQQFLGSLAKKVRSMNLLTDAPRLYGFLDATTESLTTSPKLAKITNLVELARDVQEIPSEQLIFKTVPTGAYAPDPNRVQWTAGAEQLWKAMREDKPFATPNSSKSGSPTGSSTTSSTTPTAGSSTSTGPKATTSSSAAC